MRPFDSFVYHVFPLGACGAPDANDAHSAPAPRLRRIHEHLDRIQDLGATALLLGPVWESATHGYDTLDLFTVDRRLGTIDDLAALADDVHSRGMDFMLDTVFNHVGRGFWAFQDVLAHGAQSQYRTWFHLDFARRSPIGDPFHYEGWAGNYELAKLNVADEGVREYLLSALTMWIETLGVDGLRLDAADVIDPEFLRAMAAHARAHAPGMYLVGEMVSGDYRHLTGAGLLDGTTNFEAYKGLWSSHVDENYFEIAWTLNREFGPQGIYRGLPLLNFADNHDVDRVAGSLTHTAHLHPLYGMLFTMPGVPSLYYGSEYGDPARRTDRTDTMLRPDFDAIRTTEPELPATIRRLAQLRAELAPLRHGGYRELHVSALQLSFARELDGQRVIVAVNAADDAVDVPVGATGRMFEHIAQQWLDVAGTVRVPQGGISLLSG